MRPITHIVIHCSASPNGVYLNALDIDRMHRAKGWKKIGYHYVIEIDGKVVPGRLETEIGAHVAGSNATSLGVCLVGTDQFTPAQWSSLRSLVQHLQLRYRAAVLRGHRDYSPDLDGDGVIEPWEYFKLCPGFDVKEWVNQQFVPDPAHVLLPQTAA